jgi:hypothetical protein
MAGIQIINRPGRTQCNRIQTIKITGVFLLVSGWSIVLAAVAMLRPGAAQGAFAVAGAVVEALGLALLLRAHRIAPEDES